MSSQTLVAEATSLQASYAATARQSGSGEAQHVAASTATQESPHDSIDAINRLSISGVCAKRLTTDITFEEAIEDIRAANDPLYKIVVKYHKAASEVRSDEQQWMRTIHNYHCELEQFQREVKEKKLSLTEIDRQMDLHSARLVEYDVQLTAWYDHRGMENAIMAQGNDRIVEENVRQLQEDVRREEHDRRGRSRWFKDHDSWLLDQARRDREHGRWMREYNLWVRTYERFSKERSRNLKEYKELFAKQARFSRSIANCQIARFFEEVERLNDAADDSVKQKPDHKSELNNEATLRDHQSHGGEGMERTVAAKDNQGSFENGMERREARQRRRHSL